MPEGDTPIIEACQLETHAAIQCVLVSASPIPWRGRGIATVAHERRGMGSLLLATLFGCAMFGLGAGFAAWRQGMTPLVFAQYVTDAISSDRDSPDHAAAEASENPEAHFAILPFPATEPRRSPFDSAHGRRSTVAEPVPPTEESAPPASSSLPDSAASAPVSEEVSPEEVPAPAGESSSESSSASQDSSPPSSSSDSGAVTGENPPVETGSVLPTEPPAAVLPAEIGVYLTEQSAGDEEFLLSTLNRLKSMTGAALVWTVKGGYVHFAASAPMAKELQLVRDTFDLPHVIALARERGIETVGRFIALKDFGLAQTLPETQIRHPKTNRSVGNVWVDPGNPDVITYNEQILRDLVAAGVDEINLDYIRYPTEYAQTSIGLTGNEKADRLEAFLRMARRVIDENGAKTKLGISTYAILGWNFPVNFEPLGQDIARFAPLVDVVSPMAYPATFAKGAYYNPAIHPRSRMYYLVYRTLMGYRDLLGDQAWKLRPWIQGYGITAKNLRDEIDAVFDAGACGFTVWNASNRYDLLYKELPNIVRPERCAVPANG